MTTNNFGLLIAYIVPGFITLLGVSEFSVTVRAWLGESTANAPTVSGFLYATLASVAVGLLVNAIRWHLIDPIHYLTGVPRRDHSKRPRDTEAFQFLVANQFRYYEFYSNSIVAVAFSFTAFEISRAGPHCWTTALFLAVEGLLWSASRRTLRNYHVSVETFAESA